jgi:hypothetical protein
MMLKSKHKVEGKALLKYDSIFKGKKRWSRRWWLFRLLFWYYKDSIEVDKSSNYHFESIDEMYVRNKLVKERVYTY